jgi:hypothetical protein
MKNRPASSLRSRLTRAALPAAPLALAALPSAHAAIVYTNPGATTITGSQFLYIDMGASGLGGAISTSSSGTPDFEIGYVGAGKPSIAGVPGTSGIAFADPTIPGIYDGPVVFRWAKNFQLNAPISGTPLPSTVTFLNLSTGYNNANWAPGTKGYLGVKFTAGTDGLVNGWIDVSFSADQSSITLYDFAYQSDGSAILAGDTGAIPEPAATTALAALLAGSVVLYAKRRQPQQAALKPMTGEDPAKPRLK